MSSDNGNYNNSPLVSAVIVTHNRKELVKKAIKSAQNQTYSPMEITVVDDGSANEIREELESQAEKEHFRYIYIPQEKSKGGNHARNVGILVSKGAYVAFLDDDDEWMPDKTEKQMAYLENHPECKVCHCGRIRDYNFGEYRKPNDVTILPEGDVHNTAYLRPLCVTSVLLAERDLLVDVGLFDEDLQYWQDYELDMRLFQRTNLGVVRENLVLYRVVKNDKERLTNNISGWEKATCQIYKKHEKAMSLLSQDEIKKRDLFRYHDGANRCNACGERKKQRTYLWEIFTITHNPLDLLRVILNKVSFRR